MALLKGIFLFFMRQTLIVMSRHIEYDLKNEIYRHYQSLPLSFYRRNNTGDLMARISEDVSRVRMYLGPAIMYGLNLVTLFVLVISYMLSVNVQLTLFVLLPLPFLSLSIYFVNTIINKRSEEIQRSLSGLSTYVQEAFSGIRVLKSFVREADSAARFETESNRYKEKTLGLTRVDALFYPLIMALVGISTILTVYVGGRQVIAGTLSAGNIAEFILYVYLLTWPWRRWAGPPAWCSGPPPRRNGSTNSSTPKRTSFRAGISKSPLKGTWSSKRCGSCTPTRASWPSTTSRLPCRPVNPLPCWAPRGRAKVPLPRCSAACTTLRKDKS
jgi:ABC-type multidrug transport system fused ATPase/permease subunit